MTNGTINDLWLSRKDISWYSSRKCFNHYTEHIFKPFHNDIVKSRPKKMQTSKKPLKEIVVKKTYFEGRKKKSRRKKKKKHRVKKKMEVIYLNQTTLMFKFCGKQLQFLHDMHLNIQ